MKYRYSYLFWKKNGTLAFSHGGKTISLLVTLSLYTYLSPSLSPPFSISLFLSLFLQHTSFSSIPEVSWQYRCQIDHCRCNCVIYGERRQHWSHGEDNLIKKLEDHFQFHKMVFLFVNVQPFLTYQHSWSLKSLILRCVGISCFQFVTN